MTGVGTVIGDKSGKIISFDIKNRDCRFCSIALARGKEVAPHNCQKNWYGSSKAMEAASACDMMSTLESAGMPIDTLVMDEDSTTISRLQKSLCHSITKWSDLNHIKKHVGNSLYALGKTHKQLTNTVVQYLQKCFSYAVFQNKGNTSGLRKAILAITPHAFGNHEFCGEWCGYSSQPDTYHHKTIQGNLVGDKLYADLDTVFSTLANNSAKISPCASTKDVESFHNQVSSKAPKARHYAASESLKARVSCAVAQKNMGQSYIKDVSEQAHLSPGQVFRSFAIKMDRKRKSQVLKEGTKENKVRKLHKKLRKHRVITNKENKEGSTYQSGIGLHEHQDYPEEDIPPGIIPPSISKVNTTHCNLVFFDLETSHTGVTAEIIQIAATCGKQSFSKYVLPTHPISAKATQITNLSCRKGTLYFKNNPVVSSDHHTAMSDFVQWLKDLEGPLILIAHNCKAFDSRHLLRALGRTPFLLQEFTDTVLGFVDTLPLSRVLFPDRPTGYSQEVLVRELLGMTYGAHDALADVQALQKLVEEIVPEKGVLFNFSFTVQSMHDLLIYEDNGRVHAVTLTPLVAAKSLSSGMCAKIARSGLNFSHLKGTYKKSGTAGLPALLSEILTNGKPRVTGDRRVIGKICEHFAKC